MKFFTFAFLLLSGLPVFSQISDVDFFAHAQIQRGVRTTGIAFAAGVGLGDQSCHDQSGGLLELIKFEFIQSKIGQNHEARVHLFGCGYRTGSDKTWGLQTGVSPFASFGGITGTGVGLQAYAGVHYKLILVGGYAWAAKGRENPWNQLPRSHESGIFIRIGI